MAASELACATVLLYNNIQYGLESLDPFKDIARRNVVEFWIPERGSIDFGHIFMHF